MKYILIEINDNGATEMFETMQLDVPNELGLPVYGKETGHPVLFSELTEEYKNALNNAITKR